MTSAAVAIEIVAALSKKPRQTRGVLPGCAGGAPTTTGGGSPARRAESCRVARAGRPPPRAVGRVARVPGRKRWSARAKPLCGTDPPESERKQVVPLLALHAGEQGQNQRAHQEHGGAG